ncbi:MAG TPA: hypothetical protein VG962_09210 [Steroidobacteraceae bacterium]|nr:hypothetical protein [Steroidobacteraceae bacterium]
MAVEGLTDEVVIVFCDHDCKRVCRWLQRWVIGFGQQRCQFGLISLVSFVVVIHGVEFGTLILVFDDVKFLPLFGIIFIAIVQFFVVLCNVIIEQLIIKQLIVGTVTLDYGVLPHLSAIRYAGRRDSF